jgi:serine/threonine protein kinase
MMAAAGAEGDSRTQTARSLAINAVKSDRRRGVAPPLEQYWQMCGPRRSPSDLVALVKTDLQIRFAQGERPSAEEYLQRFPDLQSTKDQVVSLVYEEFCLREEQGEKPDPSTFCDRYERWKDSLVSQLRYHRILSSVEGHDAPAVRFPVPGDHFDKFRLCRVLGSGSAGQVYLALDDSLGEREVALKISPDKGVEHSIQGRLDHEHIVPVLSVVKQPDTGLRGLCMPYRPGPPLDQVIRRVDPAAKPASAMVLWHASLPDKAGARDGEDDAAKSVPIWPGFPATGTYVDGAAWIAAKLAGALAHAHARGVYHRDVKPANILLTPRGGPQLLDFNLAHSPYTADAAEAALRGGTLPYMAPEQLEAFLDPDRWSSVTAGADLYALGLVLFELLTGQRPEGPDPDLPLARAIQELVDRRTAPFPSPRETNPAIPHAMEAILAKCLAPMPADRYQSGTDLAEDLARFIERDPLRFASNPSRRERAGNWAQRHRAAVALGLAATLTVCLVVAGALLIQARGVSGVLALLGIAPETAVIESGLKGANGARPLTVADKRKMAVTARETGWNLIKARDPEAARAAFLEAIALDPDSANAHEGMGTALFGLGDYEASRRSLAKAIELWQTRPDLVGQRFRPLLPGYIAMARQRLTATLNELALKSMNGPNPNLDAAGSLFNESIRLLDLADPLLKDQVEFREPAKLTRGDALHGLGDIARSRHNLPVAREYYRKSLDAVESYKTGDNLRARTVEEEKRKIRRALESLDKP